MVATSELPPNITVRPAGNSNSVDVVTWLRGLLSDASTVREVIDVMRCVPYSFDVGLKLSVEMILNIPDLGMFASKEVVYKVIWQTNPPGLLYKDMPLTEGVHFTSEMSPESSLKAIYFQGNCYYMFYCTCLILFWTIK